jgi:hypothetical protein
MPVIASFDTEIKISGLSIPITFDVIDRLGYDCILGVSWLQAAKAVIDLSSNTLSLYDGLISVPMIRLANMAQTVFTIANVTIPAYSESVFPVSTFKPTRRGNYIIEENLHSPCRTLLVARALVDPSRRNLPCRVLNPTNKPISLRARTPIGELASVSVASTSAMDNYRCEQLPSMTDMRAALAAKQISLTDTAVTGPDLDNLITLLYRNLDLVATSLNDLPGTDIMFHRIDTSDSPPIKTRGYRHSPKDNAEISRQVTEMRQAGVIKESDTAWGSPVILVSKKELNGVPSKRFVVDFRNLNAVTRLTSFPLPTIETVLDTVAEQRPMLWTSLDLRSGY